FVREHLNRIEQLAVTIDHPAGVASVKPDENLSVVFFSPNRDVDADEIEHLFDPVANDLRHVRLLALLRRFRRSETFEVAALKRRTIIVRRTSPPSPSPTPAARLATRTAARSAPPTATARPAAATFRTRSPRSDWRSSRSWRRLR